MYSTLSLRVQAAVAAGGTFAPAPAGIPTLTGSPWEFGDVADALQSLPGPTLLVLQALRADLRERRAEAAESAGGGTAVSGSSRKVVLVVFVGGVTHIELAALRFLSERLPFAFLVLTTGIINGTELISSVIATPVLSTPVSAPPPPVVATTSRVPVPPAAGVPPSPGRDFAPTSAGAKGGGAASLPAAGRPVTKATTASGSSNPFGGNPFK
jgi:hypothetical protein